MAAGPLLERLTELFLDDCCIGPKGAIALAGSPHLPTFSSLVLADNKIYASGIEALVACPQIAKVSCLYLDRCDVGPEGAAALAVIAVDRQHRRQLLRLQLRHGHRRLCQRQRQ